MRSIDRFALTMVPLMLRVALGATFLWAGTGKLFTFVELSPEQTVLLKRIEAGPPAPSAVTPEDLDTELPDAADAPDEADAPGADDQPKLRSLTDEPTAEPAGEPLSVRSGAVFSLAQDSGPDAQDAAPAPADANPQMRRWLVYVAFTIDEAVHPAAGTPRLPAFMGTYAVSIAWAVAVTEFLGGIGLLLGLPTRVWAPGVAGVATGVVWITEIGPAALGAVDHPFLGFLPPVWPFDPAASMHFFWALGLMLSAYSVVLTGAGALSLDRMLLGRPGSPDPADRPKDD